MANHVVTKTQRLDTSKVLPGTQERMDKLGVDHIRVQGGGEGEMPPDLPMLMYIDRVWGTFSHDAAGPATGLLGHILDLDFYTMGVGSGTRVMIKLYRDPVAMVVEINGEEVHRFILDPEALPSKATGMIAEMGRVGESFVEQNDIQPGDYCDEDENGLTVITRAEEHKHDRRAKRVEKASKATKKAKQIKREDNNHEEDIEWE